MNSKSIVRDGKEIVLTDKEAEDIYRAVDWEYRFKDAQVHLCDTIENCEDISNKNKEQYIQDIERTEKYQDLLSHMVDMFYDYQDCNIPENIVWEQIITEIEEEENHG